MKTAAIYVRVSTADQHVESQLYDLRELAAQRGLEVVQEYRDSGVSGKRARRPGLDALIADARRKKFSVVLVAAFDRVATKCEALPSSHGRVRQSGCRLHLPARKRGYERTDGTTFLDPHWLNCRTRIGLDPRTSPGWNAKGEAGRGTNRTRTDEH